MTIEFHLIIGCGAKVASFAIAVRSLSLLRQLCSKQLHRQAPALDRLGRAANGRRYKHNNARVVATTNCLPRVHCQLHSQEQRLDKVPNAFPE